MWSEVIQGKGWLWNGGHMLDKATYKIMECYFVRLSDHFRLVCLSLRAVVLI